METFSNFMAKDLDAQQGSLSYEVAPRTFVNLSGKWSEGMWSRSPTSFIGEAFSSASRLKKEATAASLSELESKSSFSGRLDLRTVYGRNYGLNRSRQVDQDETLIGDYKVERKIVISKGSRFDEPHLYLCKDGRLVNDVAVYTITITNDGNVALGPIFLQDLFPDWCPFHQLHSSSPSDRQEQLQLDAGSSRHRRQHKDRHRLEYQEMPGQYCQPGIGHGQLQHRICERTEICRSSTGPGWAAVRLRRSRFSL